MLASYSLIAVRYLHFYGSLGALSKIRPRANNFAYLSSKEKKLNFLETIKINKNNKRTGRTSTILVY